VATELIKRSYTPTSRANSVDPRVEFRGWLPSGLQSPLSIPAGECRDCIFTSRPSPEALADGIDSELDHCPMKAKARCDKLADGKASLLTRRTHRQVSHGSARTLYQKVKEQLSAELKSQSIRINRTLSYLLSTFGFVPLRVQ
jgi:hypothetical protein